MTKLMLETALHGVTTDTVPGEVVTTQVQVNSRMQDAMYTDRVSMSWLQAQCRAIETAHQSVGQSWSHLFALKTIDGDEQ